jgi:SAM-dependent methyltransferase
VSFGPASYGDAFADVYDDWYAGASDVAGTVARVAALAAGGRVLELGIGTGRLALPLAAAGCEVHGVDASRAMLDRLRAKPGGDALPVGVGDMADVATVAPGGPYAVVLVAFNTFFNLTTEADERRRLAGAAAVLAAGGAEVLEALVPADPPPVGPALHPRDVDLDRVVLTVSDTAPDGRTVTGAHVELDAAGPRLHPGRLRHAPPAELDGMAAGARLVLAQRHAGWRGEPFGPASGAHVSVYRRAPGRTPP